MSGIINDHDTFMQKYTLRILFIIFVLLIISTFYFAFLTVRYKALYDEAIKQGAEGIVTALELNVACQSLGNFTTDEVKDKWIDMFLKSRTSLSDTEAKDK